MIEKTEGIVIRTLNYGETNKIITVLTRNHGKIGLMARGAKKTKSKLSSSSQLFFYGNFLYQRGKGLGVLHQADPIDSFRDMKTDIVRMAYSAYLVEFADRITEDHTGYPELYDILIQTIKWINDGISPQILVLIFNVKMLPLAGIAANIERCVHCGEREGPFHFSMTGGGYLCRQCRAMDPYSLPLSLQASKLMTLFKHVPLERLGKLSIKKENIVQMKTILDNYYEQNAGLHLKSKRFLDQMARAELME